MTGLLAAMFLNERAFTPNKLIGVILGITGLVVIFGNKINFGPQAHWGIAGVLFSVFIHSVSAVWIKRIDAKIPALEVTNGSLLFAAPLYLVTWFVFDGQLPDIISMRTGSAIIYLAVFGSVLGFIMYFYVLKHVEASRVALITLMTPVLALLMGQYFNHEILDQYIWLGTTCILIGMICYQWSHKLDRYFVRT
jgi:drug/metabolite transporter (DMT)-like permease